MNILPRQTLHEWVHLSNLTQRRPADAQGQDADASTYRHAMRLARDAAGHVIGWNPLAAAMRHLQQWYGVVLPRVPATHELRVWFRVCFDLNNTRNAARTESYLIRAPGAVRRIEQDITHLIE